MKKTTTIFGVLSAISIIAGVIHKIFHLPGAGYLLTFGLGIFLMVYMILLCIQKIKESKGREKVMHIVKYISYMFLAIGFLFLIERFPGSLLQMDIGFAIFILGYLPLKFLVQRAKHPEGGALNKIIPSLIIVALIFALASRNTDEKLLEAIAYSDMQVKTMTTAMDTSSNHLMKEFELSKSQFPSQINPKFEKAVKIKQMSESLVEYLNTCKKEATQLCCKVDMADTLRLDEMKGMNKTFEAKKYFIGDKKDYSDGKAFEIRNKISVFNDSVNMIMDNDSAHRITVPLLLKGYKWKSTGESTSWEMAIFYDNRLINDLAYLDLLILSVKQTEKDVVSSLLSEARSEAMWTFWRKYKELAPDKKTK